MDSDFDLVVGFGVGMSGFKRGVDSSKEEEEVHGVGELFFMVCCDWVDGDGDKVCGAGCGRAC